MRISLEEEKARQEAEAAKNVGSGSSEDNAKAGESSMAIDSHGNDEDAELQAALAMSMNDRAVQDEDETMEDLSEEDALKRAMEMSMAEGNENNEDEEMMSAVLGSLPGVDKNDERIQKALEDMDKKKNEKK